MLHLHTVLFVLVMLVVLSGCSREQQPVPPKVDAAPAHAHGNKTHAMLVVPDAVRGKWKAVKVVVTDKSIAKQDVYSIPVGGKLALPSSTMTVTVEAFLPAFVMEGTSITSASNELKNPGAKVVIRDGATIVFNGWLFARFPNTHAFMHPRFGFALVDATPAK